MSNVISSILFKIVFKFLWFYSSLNNNVLNGECCADCDTTAQHDHMIAASLVYCDQEDSDSDANDDCCIYTYRGQEPAFDNNVPVDDRSTSPLMDYLEMDFDPEPTVGNESEDEEIIVADIINNHK